MTPLHQTDLGHARLRRDRELQKIADYRAALDTLPPHVRIDTRELRRWEARVWAEYLKDSEMISSYYGEAP